MKNLTILSLCVLSLISCREEPRSCPKCSIDRRINADLSFFKFLRYPQDMVVIYLDSMSGRRDTFMLAGGDALFDAILKDQYCSHGYVYYEIEKNLRNVSNNDVINYHGASSTGVISLGFAFYQQNGNYSLDFFYFNFEYYGSSDPNRQVLDSFSTRNMHYGRTNYMKGFGATSGIISERYFNPEYGLVKTRIISDSSLRVIELDTAYFR